MFRCPMCGEKFWDKVMHLVHHHGYVPPGTWSKKA